MKRLLYLIVALVATASSVMAKNPVSINEMTFNIRLDTPVDKENQWCHRSTYAAEVVRFHNVDIFGAQEVLHNQLIDLLDGLNGYAYVGVGRTDGKEKGEYSPIIYKKDRFSVESSGNFWLSEDMNAPGVKGWDAACERVATWAIMRDKRSESRFFMLNTHLDHMGKVARHEGAKLVIEQVHKLSKGLPVFVTGDFNATPDDDPIKVITNPDDPWHLTHSRDIAELRYGIEGTFQNFGRIPVEEMQWIDYIFVSDKVRVLRNGAITDHKGWQYPSDHLPVIAEVVIP